MIIPYLARRRGHYLLYTVALLLASISGLFVPWYMKIAIDSLRGGERDAFLHSLGVMVLFAIAHALFRFAGRRGFLVQAREVEYEIRETLFTSLLHAQISSFDRFSTGDLMSRSVNDLTSMWLLLGPGLLTFTGTIVTYVIGLFFMLRINPLLTGLVFSLVPLVVFLGRLYSRRLYRMYRKVQELLSRMSDRLQNYFQGIRIIKAYSMEGSVLEEFSGVAGEYSHKNIEVSKVSALFHGTVGFASGLGILAVLLVGGRFVVKGKMTVGGFVAFSSYIALLSFPTIAIGWVINLFQRGAAAAGRIGEVMAIPEERKGKMSEKEIRTIEFKDVHFQYPGRDVSVLSGLNLRIGKGETVGITGITGSGKSSLLPLLLGFYDPRGGRVLINGLPVSSYDLKWVRKKIGVAFQDPHLFSESILSNISFPLDFVDREVARTSAKVAEIHTDVVSFPEAYETLLGERGVTLSGGQRQRVALSRTVSHDSEFLILDDTFSSVDVHTEKRILENISLFRGEKTIVVISHRLTALSLCDRIIVMEGGAVVEEGSKEALLENKGLYYRLYMRQIVTGEMEEEKK